MSCTSYEMPSQDKHRIFLCIHFQCVNQLSLIPSIPTEPVPAPTDTTAEAAAAASAPTPDAAAAPVIPQIHVEAVQETLAAEVQGELFDQFIFGLCYECIWSSFYPLLLFIGVNVHPSCKIVFVGHSKFVLMVKMAANMQDRKLMFQTYF